MRSLSSSKHVYETALYKSKSYKIFAILLLLSVAKHLLCCHGDFFILESDWLKVL